MEIDETDKRILNAVIENSRLSLRQIAKKLGVSVATVMHRMNKLEDEKMIKKYNDLIYNKPTRIISYGEKIRIFKIALKENQASIIEISLNRRENLETIKSLQNIIISVLKR